MNLKVLRCETRAHCMACRTDPEWTERVVGVGKFPCPHGVTARTQKDGSVKLIEITISAKAKNVAKNASKAIKSIVKTEVLRMDRADDELYKERLNTCANCPGGHAVFKNGTLYTCGKMLDSITGAAPTCGCVLTKKARDKKQECPMKYWKR